MSAICGVRSLYTSGRFLRLCPRLPQAFPSCTHKEFNKFYGTLWPSLRITNLSTRKVNSVSYLNSLAICSSTKLSFTSREDIELNKTIRSLKTVQEHLELFDTVKIPVDMINKVTMLYIIAKITARDGKQRKFLEREKQKSQRGQSSTYAELLKSLSTNISNCQHQGLANLMWALGKIEEKDHTLLQVCENEILSRDIKTFNNAGICQIVSGCANLNLTTSDIFLNLEEVILNGQLRISTFDNQLLSALLVSFAKTGNGSGELYDVFLEEILSRNFWKMDSRALAEFVWSYAKKEFKADKLFYRVQDEILRRGTNDFQNTDFIQILWAFGKGKKGRKQLFSFLDEQLVSRGVERFHNVQLLEIVWSFAKSNVTRAEVFDLVKQEVLNRTVHKFQIHELVLILWSFVSAQRHDEKLVTEIESKLYLTDAKTFDSGDLCQIAWSLGRAGKSDSKLFYVIQAEVFQRGVSEFTTKQKCMLMRGFIEAKRGRKEFYELLVDSFSVNDLCNLHGSQICECLWCLSKAGVEAEDLFDALEREILTKGKSYFRKKQVVFIMTIFKKLGKSNRKVFEL